MNAYYSCYFRRFCAFTAVSLFLLAAVSPATSQTAEDGIRLTQRAPASGARMIGMAGAGLVGIADQSALVMNPAGLGYFQRSSFEATLNMTSTSDETLYRTPMPAASLSSDLRETGIGSLSYVYKVPTTRGSLVLGAAFNQVNTYNRDLAFAGENSASSISRSFLPYDDEYEIAFDNDGFAFPRFFNETPELAYLGGAIEFLFEEVETGGYPFYEAVAPSTRVAQDGEVVEEGRLSELSFGGAAEAVPGVMAGASINLAFGSYEFRSRFTEDDAFNENRPEDYIVILENGDELRGFNFLRYTEGLETDLVGINGRFGVSATFSAAVRAGVVLETPSYYNVTEEFHRTIETFFDEGGSLSHGGEPGDAGEGSFEYSITTPWRLGGGVAFAAAGLTVSADAEYVDWSQLRFSASSDGAYFDAVNDDIRDNLEGVFNTHFGVEYNFTNLSVRGGLAFQPDPTSSRRADSGDDLDRDRTFFSLGASYRVAAQLFLDAGWMQERFDDLYVPYRDVETPPIVEEGVVRNRFLVGVRYQF